MQATACFGGRCFGHRGFSVGGDWGFRRRLRPSERVVGWVVNPTKQVDFTVLLGHDPTYACYRSVKAKFGTSDFKRSSAS